MINAGGYLYTKVHSRKRRWFKAALTTIKFSKLSHSLSYKIKQPDTTSLFATNDTRADKTPQESFSPDVASGDHTLLLWVSLSYQYSRVIRWQNVLKREVRERERERDVVTELRQDKPHHSLQPTVQITARNNLLLNYCHHVWGTYELPLVHHWSRGLIMSCYWSIATRWWIPIEQCMSLLSDIYLIWVGLLLVLAKYRAHRFRWTLDYIPFGIK